MGNITQVRDGAQAVVFRDNAELAASNDYRYDALYRLVEATGREHEGQAANGRTAQANGAVVVPLRAASPSDPKAMRRYVQRYRYDAVGNLTTLQHFAGAGSYRRESAYSEHGCRLRATGNAALALHERYEHDVAGRRSSRGELCATPRRIPVVTNVLRRRRRAGTPMPRSRSRPNALIRRRRATGDCDDRSPQREPQ